MILSPSSRAAITFFATLILAITGQPVSFAEETKPEINSTANKRLQAMSEYLGGLKRFSVDVRHSMEMQSGGKEKQSHSDQRHVIIEQPNRLAVTASGDGEGTVICDGKQLFAHSPSSERYLLGDAPETFTKMLKKEAALLLGSGGTAVQFATGDWYKQAVKSATKIALLEPEQVDTVSCDRIEVSQETAKVILWVEKGEHPLLRKMQWELQLDAANAKLKMPSQVISYSNWELEPKINAKTFAIEVPKDAEKVDTLRTKEPGDEGPHPLLGAKAPDCKLTLLEGGAQKLADLKDNKVVVIDFWALWCGPCVAALPKLDQVATKFANRDVAFFAVNSGDETAEVREFREKQKLKLPIAVDPKSELSKLFNADSIPMTVIIDKQGLVQVVNIGSGDNLEKTLSDKIEAVLAGKQLAEETLKSAREARRSGKPIPAGQDAKTSKDATEDKMAFNLRTSVDPYKKVGSRRDAWDEGVMKFLTEASRHFSGVKGCKLQVELVALAEPLTEQGCDDPLVKYVHGAMLQDGVPDAASQARALKLVEQSYHGLVERGYPANRAFGAASRMYRTLKKDKSQSEKADEYLALTEKHALEAILLDDLKTNDGRTLYDQLYEFAQSLPLERMEKFCEAAKAHEEKSPFVVNMLVGEYHIKAAWKARGGSYAPEVSEEGWKGFGEHMDLARDAFEKAWKAAPKRPEAATAMVVISMGAGRSPEREMRKWFDRAVEAQIDYLAAYTNLLQGLMPRWHGSHEQMYQFGVECIENNRYDTDVPYEFCDAVWQIMQDDQNSLGNQYAQRPGLYQNAQKVCQGYVNHGKDKANIAWWKTVWLGFAYSAQQWNDAARLLKELGSEVDTDALGRFPLAANEIIQAVHLHASPHAKAILAAFGAADSGKREAAVDALKAILTKEGLEPSVKTQVASRLQGLDWSGDFLKGGTVSLIPAANLHGWRIVSGAWSQTPAGELKGVSDDAGVILECQAEFGKRWQLSGEIVHGKSPYNPWDAGILLNVDGRPQFSMMFNPTEQWVAVAPQGELKKFRQPFTGDGKTTKFVMRVVGDTVNVWLNDVLVVKDQEVEGLSAAPSSRVGIGAKYRWAGSTLTFRNLNIELIKPKE
jgi:peroxiredoxin